MEQLANVLAIQAKMLSKTKQNTLKKTGLPVFFFDFFNYFQLFLKKFQGRKYLLR